MRIRIPVTQPFHHQPGTKSYQEATHNAVLGQNVQVTSQINVIASRLSRASVRVVRFEWRTGDGAGKSKWLGRMDIGWPPKWPTEPVLVRSNGVPGSRLYSMVRCEVDPATGCARSSWPTRAWTAGCKLWGEILDHVAIRGPLGPDARRQAIGHRVSSSNQRVLVLLPFPVM